MANFKMIWTKKPFKKGSYYETEFDSKNEALNYLDDLEEYNEKLLVRIYQKGKGLIKTFLRR